MDRAVHHFFEQEKPQPFDDAGAEKVARAVQQARMSKDKITILVSHDDIMLPPLAGQGLPSTDLVIQ